VLPVKLVSRRNLFSFLAAVTFIPVSFAIDVLTWHNDSARTGQNLSETILTPANVNFNQFGKLFVVPTDGQVYAQPLYVSNLTIPGKGVHNVIYIATEHDSVYACDADNGVVLWQVSVLKPGETPSDDRGSSQITPEIGITATPVINRNVGLNGTIYVAPMSKDSSGNYLYAYVRFRSLFTLPRSFLSCTRSDTLLRELSG
jgi:outer membrane protein assembly factor BamB